MSEKRVPELRFKGFDDAWEQRKLKEVAGFSKGRGYSKSDLVSNGTPLILYGRLYTKYETVITAVDTFVVEKENSVFSSGNEVIVPASGESSEDIARASVVKDSDIILGGDLNVIKPYEEVDSVFLALTISNGKQQKELSKRAQGKSVVHLYNTDLKKVELLYPTKGEQFKIGKFFSTLDNTIALHQRKLERLKELKRGYLQMMFPQDGENIPKMRFGGFEGDWRQRKLGEVSKLGSSKRIHAKDYVDDGVPFYRGSEISNGAASTSTELYISEEKYSEISEQYGVPQKNDILITAVGTIGNVWKVDNRRFYYKDGNLILLSESSGNADFMVAYLSEGEGKRKILGSSSGSNQKALTMVKLKEVHLHLPIIPEQTAVGVFFSTLDTIISFHQQKVNDLTQIKKAFLQKLFI